MFSADRPRDAVLHVLPHASQAAFLVGALSTIVLIVGGVVAYATTPALVNVSRFDLLYAFRQLYC